MSEKGMKVLLSKGKLPELKSVKFDMGESCILGKQKKVSFLKGSRTPKSKELELVHTDLWGLPQLHPSEVHGIMLHSLMTRAETYGFIF